MWRVPFTHRLALLAMIAATLWGCGGCQEKELAPPRPVQGQLPRPAAKAAQTAPPAVEACAVLAYADADGGPAPLTVQVTADGDCSQGEAQYAWDFGDGSPPASGSVVTHTFTKPGNYKVRATITSSENPALKDFDEVPIAVSEPEG